jgi:DNA-directed RNA polymerase specialized sigma24 family protein
VLVENITDMRTTHIDNIEVKIEAEKVWNEMENYLTVSEKTAMKLRYKKDLAINDIADLMHKSSNAVKLLLSHARKKLRHLEYFQTAV